MTLQWFNTKYCYRFDYRIVATSATLYGEIGAGSTSISPSLIGAYSLTTTNWYRKGVALGNNTSISVTGASTTAVATLEDKNTYSVEVGGLYDGTTVKLASFKVYRHTTAGTTSISANITNPADITCTVSGATLQINTTNALAYILSVTVIKNSSLGQFL